MVGSSSSDLVLIALERVQRMTLADDAGIRGLDGRLSEPQALPPMKVRDGVGPLYKVGFVRTGSNGD